MNKVYRLEFGKYQQIETSSTINVVNNSFSRTYTISFTSLGYHEV